MDDFEEERFQFDANKFKDVVHYIIDYVYSEFGPDALGNTKLHKSLYYSDMLHYLDDLVPMTGAEYQRQKFGPTARNLTRALDQLAEEGRIKVQTVNYFGYPKKEYMPLQNARLDRLSEKDLSTLRHVAGFVCKKTAVEISDFSHDDVWESVPMGSVIPYFAAHAMFPPEFSEEDLLEAQAEAQELELTIEGMASEGRHF